jgi:hypothetical protein
MAEKYLYGASVQGIQDFIFKTDKLAEIVGASELVEQICTTLFLQVSGLTESDQAILQIAAGNVKCEFTDEAKLAYVVRNFPLEVQKMAPGITINQAVVPVEGEDNLQKLEEKLKIQRNKIATPLEIGFMGLERDRRTGEIAYKTIKKQNGKLEIISESTEKKRAVIQADKERCKESSKENLFKKLSELDIRNEEIAFHIEDISASGKNSWIAVIHADGNGLGQILQGKGKEISEKGKNRDFSKAIEDATKKAVQSVFKSVIEDTKNTWNKEGKFRYPIRPVIFGGDDLTVIIRADLALEFTRLFLEKFEETSKTEFKSLGINGLNHLTACAGIAFVKKSYPLHYALHLAEELCIDAKKKVKKDLTKNELPKSALAFHKVQDSFVEDLDSLKGRTLNSKVWNFYHGPYLLDEIKSIQKMLSILNDESKRGDKKTKAIGKLRQIVSESYKDKSTTIFMLSRMKEINTTFYTDLELDKELTKASDNDDQKSTSPLLDLITLHGFNYGDKNN